MRPDVHDLIIGKLAQWVSLDDGDRAAIRDLPVTLRQHQRHARIAKVGDRPTVCSFIIEGLAIRSKTTVAGARQIFALLQPGDLVDVQQIVLGRLDHDLEALSAMRVGQLPAQRLVALAAARPAIGRAIWIALAIEGSITREMLLNAGRRDGVARVAHLLCEMACRMSSSSEPLRTFELPLTQEQIGDMTALTGVHVNRVLRTLRERGLATKRGRSLTINDWARLAQLAGFSPDYLHLDTAKTSSTASPEDNRSWQPRSGSRLG